MGSVPGGLANSIALGHVTQLPEASQLPVVPVHSRSPSTTSQRRNERPFLTRTSMSDVDVVWAQLRDCYDLHSVRTPRLREELT